MHLGHRAVINMQNRPYENVEEMNDALITNYNKRVHNDDTVYILGDLVFRVPVLDANELIKKLKGKKILIKGNHDKNYDSSLFVEMLDFKELSLNGKSFSLMHYPMLSWPKSRYGSIMLHGHCHNTFTYNIDNREEGILRYDVGVDANNYYPVSIDEILKFFNLK